VPGGFSPLHARVVVTGGQDRTCQSERARAVRREAGAGIPGQPVVQVLRAQLGAGQRPDQLREAGTAGDAVTSPRTVTLASINRVLRKLELPPITLDEIRPLRAAG